MNSRAPGHLFEKAGHFQFSAGHFLVGQGGTFPLKGGMSRCPVPMSRSNVPFECPGPVGSKKPFVKQQAFQDLTSVETSTVRRGRE